MRLGRSLVLAISFLAACGDQASPPKPTADTATAATTTSATAATTATAAPTESAAAAEPSAEPTGSASASAVASADGQGVPGGTSTAAPSASAQASAKPDVEGEQKKGGSFSAYLSAKPSYKKGQPATVTAIVNALGEYHVNQEYPYKFKMGTAPAGVTYPEAVVRSVSRTEKRATMPIPFTPDASGTATISGECALSVCTDSNCVIEKVPLSVTVKIED